MYLGLRVWRLLPRAYDDNIRVDMLVNLILTE